MKGSLSNDRFIELCTLVTDNYRKITNNVDN